MVRAVAAGLLLFLSAVSLLTAWQQAHLLLADKAFDQWVTSPSAPIAKQLERFLTAAQIFPDPKARWLRGRWTMARNPADPAALEDFAAVAIARPYDFHPALAAARWWAASDPSGPQFAQAMDEAVARGPNESKVFAAIFPLARLHWHYLSPGQHERLENLLVRTALREPALAIELARDYGFAGPACSLTETNSLAQGHCQRLGIINTEKENP